MGKYSDIRRGVELNAALTKLREWEDKTRSEKQTLYRQQRGASVKVNPIRVKGYVESFGLAGRVFLPVRLLAETQTLNGGLIAIARTATSASDRNYPVGFTPPTEGVKLDGLGGFKPAKLLLTQRGAPVADSKSRITDIEYKRYDNKSVSSPFGQATAGTELYQQAVEAILDQSEIETFLATDGNRVSFSPEML